MHAKLASAAFDWVVAAFGHVEMPTHWLPCFCLSGQTCKLIRQLRSRLVCRSRALERFLRDWAWPVRFWLQWSLWRLLRFHLRQCYQVNIDPRVVHQPFKGLFKRWSAPCGGFERPLVFRCQNWENFSVCSHHLSQGDGTEVAGGIRNQSGHQLVQPLLAHAPWQQIHEVKRQVAPLQREIQLELRVGVNVLQIWNHRLLQGPLFQRDHRLWLVFCFCLHLTFPGVAPAGVQVRDAPTFQHIVSCIYERVSRLLLRGVR